MQRCLRRFRQSESAVTSIEYALLAALIAVAIVTGVATLGDQVESVYNHVKDQVVLALQ